jgi:6-phosphogluconate dehydrogenase
MRQISAQKEVRVLIAEKYGSRLEVKNEQLKVDGEPVASEPFVEAKSIGAKDNFETAVSDQQKMHFEEEAAKHLTQTHENKADENKNIQLREESAKDFQHLVEELKNALLASFIVTYAQGMSLLQTASIEKKYDLNLAEIARIWRGGCIIRSALLEEIRRAYAEDTKLPNLMLDNQFARLLNDNRNDWRAVVEKFTESRVPVLCLSSALAYFDAFRSERLPANLIQSQRDYFGAHTYQRIDKEGVFHTPNWK